MATIPTSVTLRAVKLTVFVSGSGTLLEAMLHASLPVATVIADRACRGLEIAKSAGVDAELVERDSYADDFDRDGYSSRLASVAQKTSTELIAMAGFGTILGAPMFAAYDGRIINTHPALLPAFPGWHAVRDALAYGVKVTGCTIHVATPAVDDGPILAQEPVQVLADDTEATLHERIKVVERRLYLETIQTILDRGWVIAPGN